MKYDDDLGYIISSGKKGESLRVRDIRKVKCLDLSIGIE